MEGNVKNWPEMTAEIKKLYNHAQNLERENEILKVTVKAQEKLIEETRESIHKLQDIL